MTRNSFKKLSTPLYLAAVTLLTTTQSCKKNAEDIQAPAPVQESISAEKITELKEFVANATGASYSNVTYSPASKSFVIDNDFAVSLQDAEQRHLEESGGQKSSSSSATQRLYYFKVAPTKVSAIKIYADAKVPADWKTILDNSIANWNSINSNIRFSRVTSSTTANIIITTNYDAATTTIAYAYMPDTKGNAGNSVTINTYYSFLTTAQKIFALTHELGHSVGFTHANGTYGSLITGTPTSDPASIMNSTVRSWTSFSSYDVLAAKTVYPKL